MPTGLVLRRSPGIPAWTETRYPLDKEGFSAETLKQMVCGWFQSIDLDGTFALVCDEEGLLKRLQVAACITLRNGSMLPIVGRFAVVRIAPSASEKGMRIYTGLERGDMERVKTAFRWSYPRL